MRKAKFPVLLSLFLVVAFAFAAVLPSVAHAGKRHQKKTIAELVASKPEHFSTLLAALEKAELVDALNGRKQYTVFAPDNAAFDAAAEAILGPGNTGLDLVNAIPKEDLTDILLYHVTRGKRLAKSLFPPKNVKMLNGDRAMTSLVDGKPFIAGQPIIKTDVRASNGVIHVLGGVMLPPPN